ncbi:MAG: xanthine dehydrogenase family protein subunit M [Candidatus Bathyarchaeia archaeon]
MGGLHILYSHVEVISPESVLDALEALYRYGEDIRIVAGSTDISVMLKDAHIRENKFLDLSHVDNLRYIKAGKDGMIHIGALATYGDCTRNRVLRKRARILLDSVETIGSPQIRNLATVAGNLGNASPAGDAIPPLFVLDAKVVLESKSEKREISIEQFFSGYRKTVRKPTELIGEISFHPVTQGELTFFRKLGLRHANAIAVASVAFWGKRDGDTFSQARIALGAVAPTVIRARRAEEILVRATLTPEKMREVAKTCAEESSPISDIRGTAAYRRQAVEALTYIGLMDTARAL